MYGAAAVEAAIPVSFSFCVIPHLKVNKRLRLKGSEPF
jgi:hypothetical protein